MRTLEHPDPNAASGPKASPGAGQDASRESLAAQDVVREQTEIAAPVDAVFDALVDPEQLAAWCRAAPDTALTEWHTDVRPGGRWEGTGTDGAGRPVRIAGTYTTVERARRLETSWETEDGARPSVVRFDLEPVVVGGRAGTRLTVTHTGRSTTGATMAVRGCAIVPWSEQVARIGRLVVRDASRSALRQVRPAWEVPPSTRRTAVRRAHRAHWTYVAPTAGSITR